jgi:hypothetical protein
VVRLIAAPSSADCLKWPWPGAWHQDVDFRDGGSAGAATSGV